MLETCDGELSNDKPAQVLYRGRIGERTEIFPKRTVRSREWVRVE